MVLTASAKCLKGAGALPRPRRTRRLVTRIRRVVLLALLVLLLVSLSLVVAVTPASPSLPQSPHCGLLHPLAAGREMIAQLTSYDTLPHQEEYVSAVLNGQFQTPGVGIEIRKRAPLWLPTTTPRHTDKNNSTHTTAATNRSLPPTDFVLFRVFSCLPVNERRWWIPDRMCHRVEEHVRQLLLQDVSRRVKHVHTNQRYSHVDLLSSSHRTRVAKTLLKLRDQDITNDPSSTPISTIEAQSQSDHSQGSMNQSDKDSTDPPTAAELESKTLTQRLLVDQIGVRALWERGYRGQGVKVGVFDTGLSNTRFHSVKERINWTNEKKTDDYVGHGTFVASVIGGSDEKCPGLAPDADLFVFRTFTSDQLSFTSWFLDAFNYALHLRIKVLNLSTGGPDFQDRPFVDKIQELTANGVIIVSAVGNGGPQYGTLTNPADQMEVLGVGGVGLDGDVARFSSRGMTAWEFPFGAGRVKPDLVTLAEDIPGAAISSGCRVLSGTSVAAPIVTAAIAVLASMIPDEIARWELMNPASIKQLLLESADRIPARMIDDAFVVQNHIFEQGAGRLNVTSASNRVSNMWSAYQRHRALAKESPQSPPSQPSKSNSTIPTNLIHETPTADRLHETLSRTTSSFNHSITAFPARIDATQCPYMWPLCSQPLFHTSLPLMVNLTLINPAAVAGTLDSAATRWVPSDTTNGDHLSVSVASPDTLWPYFGSVGVFIEIKEQAAKFRGVAQGALHFFVQNDPQGMADEVVVPVSIPVIPTPPKTKRILWDQFHNMPYPSAFIPRDRIDDEDDYDEHGGGVAGEGGGNGGELLDHAGDHPHTNFHQLWNFLIGQGFAVDILPFEYSCLDLSRYGVVLVVDPEEEFFAEEITALHDAVTYANVSLLVFADWYDDRVLDSMDVFDTSTLSHWQPVTGGANVPALNELLRGFHIEFAVNHVCTSDDILLLDTVPPASSSSSSRSFPYWSGTHVTKFPVGGYLAHIDAIDQSSEFLNRSSSPSPRRGGTRGGDLQTAKTKPRIRERVPVLGLYQVPARKGGRIAVFGDSSCLDASVHLAPLDSASSSATAFRDCFPMLQSLLRFTNDGIHPDSTDLEFLTMEYSAPLPNALGAPPDLAGGMFALDETPSPTPAPPPPSRAFELRGHRDAHTESAIVESTAVNGTGLGGLDVPAPTISARAAQRAQLMAKHSKVLRAMQQKPVRASFCAFHRRETCRHGDLHDDSGMPTTRDVTTRIVNAG